MIRRPPRSTLFPYTTLFRSVHHDVPRETGQVVGDTRPAQPFLALEVLRLVEVGRIPLERLDVAYRDGDDHVRHDNDGEDDGEVEPLVVTEVPVVVASERHHPSPLPSDVGLAQEELGDLDRIRRGALPQLIADHPEVQAGRA